MGGGKGDNCNMKVSLHWFRQDLRLHDNPALLEALKDCDKFYLIFIYDGKTATMEGTDFNRVRFLSEALQDMDNQLRHHGGRLHVIQGDTIPTLTILFQEWGITKLTYQEEPEAIWKERDDAVKQLCRDSGVERVSKIGHTLWDPHQVIEKNGGEPPLTYAIFNHVTDTMGPPAKPCGMPEFGSKLATAGNYEEKYYLPSFAEIGFGKEALKPDNRINKWVGGETEGLRLLEDRLEKERDAFEKGFMLPNQYLPDLVGPPKSLSSHLKFGNVSVRKMYWDIYDAYQQVVGGDNNPIQLGIVAQLTWREFFYTMSAQNLNYSVMKNNPICLPIPWYENKELEGKVEMGQTGYPFVDAIMNQLRAEGWVHHVGRHMLASYITRGDLWLSWEVGVRIFKKYLLDYDWSICAGNWMWASSSAFGRTLDCPKCFDPVKYGQRMDPEGEYVRRYVPELQKMPLKYLFSPWLAPESVQERAECIIGKDYPMRINDHEESSHENSLKMEKIRETSDETMTKTIAPSDEEEIMRYVWLPDNLSSGHQTHCGLQCSSTGT